MTEKQTKKQIWEERHNTMEALQHKSKTQQLPILENAYKNAAEMARFAKVCTQETTEDAFFKLRAVASHGDWTSEVTNTLLKASMPPCQVLLENAWSLSQKLIAEAKEKQADMLVNNLRNMGKDFQ